MTEQKKMPDTPEEWAEEYKKMKALDSDIAVFLKKGEPVPFVCPDCIKAFPYSKDEQLTCPRCGLTGDSKLFSFYEFRLLPGGMLQ